jgi:hypothetical protein
VRFEAVIADAQLHAGDLLDALQLWYTLLR